MDVLKAFGERWFRDLLAQDPWALGFGLALLIVGSLLTTAGTKLGGRGLFALAGLGWRGVRWLTRPKPLGELAGTILQTMQCEEPTNPLDHTIWYGAKLHFYENGIYVDHTKVNRLLTRAERRRIMRAVNFDRVLLAERKIRDLRRDADTVDLSAELPLV